MNYPRRFCTNCGAEIFNPQQVYCLNCGAQLIRVPGEVKEYNLITAWLSFFKRYADFNGRSRRQEYWFAYLANFIIAMVLHLIRSGATAAASVSYNYPVHEAAENIGNFFSMAAMMYTLATVIPSLAIQTRRLHDTGRSGKLLFLWFIPSVAGALAVVIPFIIAVLTEPFQTGYYGALQSLGYLLIVIMAGVLFASMLYLALEVMFLVFYCQEGERGENKYGRSPK